jgi:hypothetical protein
MLPSVLNGGILSLLKKGHKLIKMFLCLINNKGYFFEAEGNLEEQQEMEVPNDYGSCHSQKSHQFKLQSSPRQQKHQQ